MPLPYYQCPCHCPVVGDGPPCRICGFHPQTNPHTPNQCPARLTPNTDPSPQTLVIVELHHGGQRVVQIREDRILGFSDFQHLHPEARFYSRGQFRIYRDPQSLRWAIDPMQDAANATLVNGKILRGPVWLEDAMTVAVGNPSLSTPKLVLTIRLIRTANRA